VAEEGGEVVGFCELEEDGHLDMFYVRKDAVGRGIGRSLYKAAERAALGWNLGRVFTEASVTARPFFERWGFRVVSERRVWRRGVELTNFAMEKALLGTDAKRTVHSASSNSSASVSERTVCG
jgi:putative acetyltransferase